MWRVLLGLCGSLCLGFPLLADSGADAFNYVLGTQTFGPKYQFTQKDPLVETAEVIQQMGSNVIKFALEPRTPATAKAAAPAVHSLTELARDEPAHRRVLDMPFANVLLWVTTFSHTDWKKGYPEKAQLKEYREVYDLACYLLRAYADSGKTFFLGHWEGDGMLRGSIDPKDDVRVTPEAVSGMIAWLGVRQQAVDDAKRDTPHRGVQIWHYTEVNHVTPARDAGRPAVVNKVLPHVPVDFVSYSAYDTTNRPDRENIMSAMDYIEKQLAPKAGISGRRVFIGEYGFPVREGGKEIRSAQAQDALSREVMRVGLEWGCRFVLYWELYNNEVGSGGEHAGFWMIDDRGRKQPVYETHAAFYAWARVFVGDHLKQSGVLPEEAAYRRAAIAYLGGRP